jgi:hypothetical protein
MSTISPTQIASDGYAAYQAYQQIQRGIPSTPSASFGTIANGATTALSIAGILDSNATEKEKALAVREQAGLFVADLYTFGLTSTVVGLFDRYLPGVTNTIRKFLAKEPIFNAIVGLFDTNRWKTEGNRLRELQESGISIPEQLQGAMQLTRGRSKEELIDPRFDVGFRGVAPDGTWVNNAFAMSRDESLLTPQDIWGYAAFFEKFGNEWLGKYSEQQRYAIAKLVLDRGAVREHHGTIDVTWSAELEAAVQSLLNPNGPVLPG